MHLDRIQQAPQQLGNFLALAQNTATLLDWIERQNVAQGLLPDPYLIVEAYRILNKCLLEAGIDPISLDQMWAFPLARAIIGYEKQRRPAAHAFYQEILRLTDLDQSEFLLQDLPTTSRDRTIMTITEGVAIVELEECLRRLPMARKRLQKMRFPRDPQFPIFQEPIIVLCVDDEISAIFSTLFALLNTNFTLVPYLQRTAKDEPAHTATKRVAADIVKSGSHLVFMDQGLNGEVDGHAVIYAVRELDPHGKIVFVANSGGQGKELHAAGAFSNFSKGKDDLGLRNALHALPIPIYSSL